MASSPVPNSKLDLSTSHTPSETLVHCAGRITCDTAESLKATVKPLFLENKIVVLDLRDATYMDSSGLGAMVALYVTAKTTSSDFKLINVSKRFKELFTVTRLDELIR